MKGKIEKNLRIEYSYVYYFRGEKRLRKSVIYAKNLHKDKIGFWVKRFDGKRIDIFNMSFLDSVLVTSDGLFEEENRAVIFFDSGKMFKFNGLKYNVFENKYICDGKEIPDNFVYMGV